MPDSGPRKILVAIDFGTTFSGVAWADTRRKTQNTIKDWPGGDNNDDKVPTILQYEYNNFSGRRTWGFDIDRDSNSNKPIYEMFKLGLDPRRERETDLARRYPSFGRLANSTADTDRLVVDYLTALRENFEKQLADLPNSIDLESIPKQYVITVPAMWSERAQDRTRACAERAGMGQKQNIGIISEPEAAAIRVLEEMREDEYRFKKDDTFVVCDAGGGTVDLISYTVTGFNTDAGSKPILQVEEAVKGEGHVCGGIFVNRVFAKWFRDTYGHHEKFDEEVLEDAVREFEQEVKKRFDGNIHNTYKIKVGIPNGRDITNSKLRLSGTQVKAFFDPVIKEIEKLVLAQLQATSQRVKCVLLVGGFGGNKYLKTRLEKVVGDGVRVSKPKNTLTAVVEGALIRGLADAQPGNAHIRIESRIARRSYGTSSWVDYVPGLHERSRRSSGNYGGEYHVRTLQWFAKQNEPVRRANPFGYYWDKKASDGMPDEIKMPIYSFEATPNTGPPLYPDAPGVTELGMLRLQIGALPGAARAAAVRREVNAHGEEYYIVDFDIQMTLHSASLTFALLVQGTKYHELSLDFSRP